MGACFSEPVDHPVKRKSSTLSNKFKQSRQEQQQSYPSFSRAACSSSSSKRSRSRHHQYTLSSSTNIHSSLSSSISPAGYTGQYTGQHHNDSIDCWAKPSPSEELLELSSYLSAPGSSTMSNRDVDFISGSSSGGRGNYKNTSSNPDGGRERNHTIRSSYSRVKSIDYAQLTRNFLPCTQTSPTTSESVPCIRRGLHSCVTRGETSTHLSTFQPDNSKHTCPGPTGRSDTVTGVQKLHRHLHLPSSHSVLVSSYYYEPLAWLPKSIYPLLKDSSLIVQSAEIALSKPPYHSLTAQASHDKYSTDPLYFNNILDTTFSSKSSMSSKAQEQQPARVLTSV
jgi:hypothetical protein